jgi:hypothetical protein
MSAEIWELISRSYGKAAGEWAKKRLALRWSDAPGTAKVSLTENGYALTISRPYWDAIDSSGRRATIRHELLHIFRGDCLAMRKVVEAAPANRRRLAKAAANQAFDAHVHHALGADEVEALRRAMHTVHGCPIITWEWLVPRLDAEAGEYIWPESRIIRALMDQDEPEPRDADGDSSMDGQSVQGNMSGSSQREGDEQEDGDGGSSGQRGQGEEAQDSQQSGASSRQQGDERCDGDGRSAGQQDHGQEDQDGQQSSDSAGGNEAADDETGQGGGGQQGQENAQATSGAQDGDDDGDQGDPWTGDVTPAEGDLRELLRRHLEAILDAPEELRDMMSEHGAGILRDVHAARQVPPPKRDPKVCQALAHLIPRLAARSLRGSRVPDKTWRRPHRQDIDYLPGRGRVPRARVIIAVDVSGSMAQWWDRILATAAALRRDYDIEVVAWADRAAFVHGHQVPKVGYGTEMIPMLEMVIRERPDLLCVLSDMDIADHPTERPDCRILWITTMHDPPAQLRRPMDHMIRIEEDQP